MVGTETCNTKSYSTESTKLSSDDISDQFQLQKGLHWNFNRKVNPANVEVDASAQMKGHENVGPPSCCLTDPLSSSLLSQTHA